MNRFSLSVAAALIAISVVGSGCARVTPRLVQDQGSSMEQPQESLVMGVLVTDSGKATVTRGERSIQATPEMELLPGDTVNVTEGTVAVAYTGAGASYLEEGTEITLLPDGKGQGSVFLQIDVAAGSIWTRFERLLGADERFSVTGNGVVATVRGTAFGMEIMPNNEVDLEVADHEIDVTLLEARKDAKLLKKALRLKNGEGLRIGVQAMMRLEAAGMQRLVRKLNKTEKDSKGFKMMSDKVETRMMEMKAKTHMEGRPVIPEKFRDRLDAAIMERIETMEVREPLFTAPTRAVRPGEIAPTSTPSGS